MITPERLNEFWRDTREKYILQSVKNRELKSKAKETEKLKLNKNK